jgi:hypothetical protein
VQRIAKTLGALGQTAATASNMIAWPIETMYGGDSEFDRFDDSRYGSSDPGGQRRLQP